MCRQCPSILFVLHPSSLTNSFQWFMVWCEYPYLSKLWYDFQQSETIDVPGSTQSCIIGKSVASLQSSTATRKHLLESSIPPKIHCPSTLCPQWYFRFPNLLSSIWTTFPSPHNFSLFLWIVTSHICRQNMSQSTAVLGLMCNCFLICSCVRTSDHQWVNLMISSRVRLLC